MKAMWIDIRSSFNDFVEAFGGIVSDKTEQKPHQPLNADYIFKGDSVIAELKCMEEDLEEKEEFIAKRTALIHKWVKDGLVTPEQVAVPTIYTKDLPDQCDEDLKKLYGAPIKAHLKKANRQIRQSKIEYDMPEAKGLLLLANDGNHSLEAKNVLYILIRLLNSPTQFPFINTILYFTPTYRHDFQMEI